MIFRSFVAILSACILLAGLPAMSQSSGTSQSGSASSTQATSQQSQSKQERITLQNLVIQGFEPNKLVLTKERYFYTVSTTYTSASGRPTTRSNLKTGQVVDIVYLTGGTRTEGYPFQPYDKVLVSVRVVADSKR